MIEMMMAVGGDYSNTGIGPTTLLSGDSSLGYFGKFTAPELNVTVINNTLNITEGSIINTDTDWLKFYYNGKIILTPSKPIRTDISWNHLYLKGCVYGTDDIGTYPGSVNTIQSARITLGNFTYKVRLFHGADTNPTSATYNTLNPAGVLNSEYNKLFGNVYVGGSRLFASLSNTDLGIISGTTQAIYPCIEKHTYSLQARVFRGVYGSFTIAMYILTNNNYTMTSSDTYHSQWRPILELI